MDGDGNVSTRELPLVIHAAQGGQDLLANVFDGSPFDGRVFSDSKKDVGRGHLSACGYPAGLYLAFAIRSAKTFSENRAGVSGRMILACVQSTPQVLRACKKVLLQRTSRMPDPLFLCR